MSDARWCIDFAYVEQGCLFLFGWFVEPGPGFQGLLLHANGRHIDLGRNVIRTPRPDLASLTRSMREQYDRGLLVAAAVGPDLVAGERAELWVVLPDGAVHQIPFETSGSQPRFVHFARGNLLPLLHLLANVPEAQRKPLSAIADRARTQTTPAELAATDPFTVTFICAPVPDLLVFAGSLADPVRNTAPIELMADGSTLRRRLRQMPAGRTALFVLIAEPPPALTPERFVLSQRLPSLRHEASFERADIRHGMAAFDALLRPLDADLQLLILESAAETLAPRADPAVLDRLRSMWRERIEILPPRLDHVSPTLRLVLDRAQQIGPHGIYLSGWALYDPAEVRSIALRVPFLQPYELPTEWVADARPDVWKILREEGLRVETDELGFSCYVPVSAPPEGASLAVTLTDGRILRVRVDIEPMPDEPLGRIKSLLTGFHASHRDLRRLLDRHIGPAVGALWSHRRRPAQPPAALGFGPPPAAPETSVVVPIYGRADFMEFQLAQFANDPFMAGQELIYVIDDPAIYDGARTYAPELYATYRVPFMMLYANRNNGFAAATNLGAAGARGEFLLLLNSDVIPKAPFWLRTLVAAHRAQAAGAVGPKLLYEDGGIQHAGMRFARMPAWSGLFVNEHPGKGQPNRSEEKVKPVQALTGACLLLRASQFRALGGLSEDYIIGDFEDSDLCLRLRREGLGIFLIPGVELYHLERQSQNNVGSATWRANLTLYNCWLHNSRWHEDISVLTEAEDA